MIQDKIGVVWLLSLGWSLRKAFANDQRRSQKKFSLLKSTYQVLMSVGLTNFIGKWIDRVAVYVHLMCNRIFLIIVWIDEGTIDRHTPRDLSLLREILTKHIFLSLVGLCFRNTYEYFIKDSLVSSSQFTTFIAYPTQQQQPTIQWSSS